jgi:short-subunit dehydrogenase
VHRRASRSLQETAVLVTGATDGLGRGVAERLASEGATVLIHGRDPERLAATAAEIERATGNGRIRTLLADLASLEQVRSLSRVQTGARLVSHDPLGRSAGRGRQPGGMFLLWWKALSGSYLALTSTSRR